MKEEIRRLQNHFNAGKKDGFQVKMEAPLWDMNKSQVVGMGIKLGMTHEEFEHTWSCYEGGEKPCGTCGTCIDRKEAFVKNGIMDIN